MRNKVARIVFSLLIPITIFAASKEKKTTELKVVSSKTKIHGSFPGVVFIYTSIMFTQVNGTSVVYECDQRGDLCPLMESGATYPADRVGNVIYIPMSFPAEKRSFPVRYKQVGTIIPLGPYLIIKNGGGDP
jgi:hypothetical protein